jgi:hypothetical protein
MTNSVRERAISELNDETDIELFVRLDVRVQDELQVAFIEGLDRQDIEEFIFSLIGSYDGSELFDTARRAHGRWSDFLRSRDIRNRYSERLEESIMDDFGGCEDEDFADDRDEGHH